jgi:hypothetical protein
MDGSVEQRASQGYPPVLSALHPDRWPDTLLAHELTVALVALRATLRPGEQGAPPAGR